METQGKRLKQFRKEKGLKQDDLGAIFNVSRQVVANLEADRILLNNEKLVSLCENFNLNMNWLLCGKGEMFNPPPFEQVESNLAQRMEKMENALKRAGLLED